MVFADETWFGFVPSSSHAGVVRYFARLLNRPNITHAVGFQGCYRMQRREKISLNATGRVVRGIAPKSATKRQHVSIK